MTTQKGICVECKNEYKYDYNPKYPRKYCPECSAKKKAEFTKRYGRLKKDTWRDEIKKGFDECWRVLEDYGILIFKWNEFDIKKKEVLDVIGKDPLFGHTTNRATKNTHWLCFMKIPNNTIA